MTQIKSVYTVFTGSSYHKSYTNKAEASKEAARLRRDGATRVKINKTKRD